MALIFRSGEENTAARCKHRARISTLPGRKRPPSRTTQVPVSIGNLQSFQLGLLRAGQRREKLAVFAPRRSALLARTQNPGAQTIQFEGETL